VDDEVEAAQFPLDGSVDGVDVGIVRDIARQDDRRLRQSLGKLVDVLLEPALIGERQTCAAARRRLRDRPGDRTLVGDADDEPDFAVGFFLRPFGGGP
jgi:hypothetical protein